ncbi:MAG: twin-arginine translocase subunit TatC, partial [Acidobacteria bacterium]
MATTIQNPPPTSPGPEPEEEQLGGRQMSFLEHLEELRARLLRSAASILIGTGICFYFRDAIYGYMARPLTETLRSLGYPDRLIYNNPTDPFNLYIKLSMVGGIFLASPYILWQVWLFISPGLYRHEKRYVWPFVVLTSGLFMLGGLFAYKMAFPAALKFLLQFAHQFQPLISINEY